MAQAHALRGIAEMKNTINSDYTPKDRVSVLFGKKEYFGTVHGKWSNFGITVLFDGDNKTTILNLKSDKVKKI